MILCHADKDDTKMYTHPVHSLRRWIAQSVEQQTRMSPGSIPATGSTYRWALYSNHAAEDCTANYEAETIWKKDIAALPLEHLLPFSYAAFSHYIVM